MQLQWIDEVTDRTMKDVERAGSLHKKGWKALSQEERLEWLSGLKGALNISDLERLENNIELLSGLLGLDLNTCLGNIPEIPDSSYFTQLLSNIGIIREAYCIHDSTPKTPQMPFNDYSKMNDAESILSDVYHIFNQKYHYLCGEGLYAGDETGLLL